MPKFPPHISSLLTALKLGRPDQDALKRLPDHAWHDLLWFSDNMRLTLQLDATCQHALPDWVQERIARNRSDNVERFERIKAAYLEIADALSSADVEFVVLKGFAHFDPGRKPQSRMQGDIDLFSPPECISSAKDVLCSLGYQPLKGFDDSPSDHLPAMIRDTGSRWQGDFFDPSLPLFVDLHLRFWDHGTAHFGPTGLEEFWSRRIRRHTDELSFPALHPADALAYAALHALRHLLHGTMATNNFYELAHFLHTSADDEASWNDWRQLHGPSLRRLQAVCFCLAADWFDGRLPAIVQDEILRLPSDVRLWAQEYGKSPMETWFRPNKDALWLHLSLIESARDKRVIFRQALFPTRLPAAAAVDPLSHDSEKHPAPKPVTYVSHVLSRAAHHARILPATLYQGARWWWKRKRLGKQFWIFMGTSFFLTLGMSIFFLLYNLYLLDLGFRESFLGLVASALAVGSIAGTILAGLMAQRIGLRPTVLACLAACPIVFALRALFMTEALQIALAFLGGMALSAWAVCISPALAHLTTEDNRPFGFSLVFSSGIGIGVLGGLLGGNLPDWLARIAPTGSTAHAKQLALLLSAGIVALGLWPGWRLSLPSPAVAEKRFYPRNPFLLRFLPAIALWSLASGMVIPFFNAYFSRHLRMPLTTIGMVFSGSQLAQVLAILLAPAVFRKFGLIAGIVYMQLAAALMLGCLAAGPAASAAVVTYMGFTAFQWMSEPGMYTLLMNRVSPSERSGASAMNALVISLTQAVAAAVAGASLVKFGYPVVQAAAAVIALGAALAFGLLLRDRSAAAKQVHSESDRSGTAFALEIDDSAA
jgi:MFS family permease